MLERTLSKEERTHCFKSLETLFGLDSFNNDGFSISAVQKGCLISFFEAKDIIDFGLSEGMIMPTPESENASSSQKYRFANAAHKRFYLDKAVREGRKYRVDTHIAG